MSDDDWFERALRDDEADDPEDAESVGDAEDAEETATEESKPTEETQAGEWSADVGGEERPDGPSDPSSTQSTSSGTSDRELDVENTRNDDVGDAGGDDFGFGDSASGGDDFGFGASDSGGGDFGFGDSGAGGGDFGFGGSETDEDEFGFGDFGDTGSGGDEFGFGGGDGFGAGDDGFGPGGDDFDEESLDSDIDRVKIGIDGLDEMILGGIPKRSLMVAIGSAGTGKTTFGLQFLDEALRDDGRAVFITLEQSREAVLSTAEEKGWPFRRYVEEDRLAVVELDPVEMANSLASIRNDLPELIEEFGADRLVLDSVSLLEMMYDHPSKRRSEVFDFARSLKEVGVTTMLTSEAREDSPYTSKHGIVEYLTDAVFVLQYVRPSNFRETRLAIEIQKIRDANHSRETKPYEITQSGISVYRQANIF
ncbi:circadian clock protein KaiC [Haloprofundus marisrubri]|uniref:Circadian clock protein KaiC n=1 Tax=Haloprofundus marisrubri TaxID=1514971 RepID=A0A0W1R852_9EURY|nr:KaiC domain-containing protein [Haloprofundus marisrubri]KTG09330.1 circadian clock protein KaiC [Haloprofundus marisrubri]